MTYRNHEIKKCIGGYRINGIDKVFKKIIEAKYYIYSMEANR